MHTTTTATSTSLAYPTHIYFICIPQSHLHSFFKLGVHVSELIDEMVIEEEGSFDITSKEPLEMTARFYEETTGKTYPEYVFLELKKGYR